VNIMDKPAMNQVSLANLFTDITQEGGFSAIILTDESGLPIVVSSISGDDAEIHAATVSKIQQTISQTKDHLSMSDLEEFSMYDSTGKRLIIRPFNTSASILFLAILIPGKSMPYKRLMNKAIRIITREWNI
jgi:predicted regulator of Ras-like GTPase activity (Roadblock/LC7/MglB family)